MIVGLAAVAAVLFGVGVYLLIQRTLTRILIGIGLIGHAANLLLLLAGGPSGRPPLVDGGRQVSDPLPQALALTAIVITFGVTLFLLALAFRSVVQRGNDDVEDDPEDRRISRLQDVTSDDTELAQEDSDDGVVRHQDSATSTGGEGS
ncbi:MAG: sodium:proton antiporter [Actinobacteria bacterium ATB1]|nr:sodium:proton antiporter [Actinobacteria bacterium ATB1]